jgi:hypothetical protein
MAQGDAHVYNNYKEQVLLGSFSLVTATIKLAILDAHTLDIDDDDEFLDVQADEASGSGYVAGGATVGSKAVAQDNPNDRATFSGGPVVFSGLDVGTALTHAVMYEADSSAGILICAWENTIPTNGGDYTFSWPTNIILTCD